MEAGGGNWLVRVLEVAYCLVTAWLTGQVGGGGGGMSRNFVQRIISWETDLRTNHTETDMRRHFKKDPLLEFRIKFLHRIQWELN